MRVSTLFARTLRDDPAEAEVASHRLLLRAAFIRKTAAGIYTTMPLGLRTMNKIEGIVREEMDAAGSQQLRMPIVLPAATVAALQDAIVARPGSKMKVDLAAQIVVAPDGTTHEFAIDPFAKHCMLNGLDEVDYTLSQMQTIVAFERGHDDEMPAPTGGQR